jgi:hypothetical protein
MNDQGRFATVADPPSRPAEVEATVNSIMQIILKEMTKQGCKGGLGDSRILRAAIREVVDRNAPKPRNARLAFRMIQPQPGGKP